MVGPASDRGRGQNDLAGADGRQPAARHPVAGGPQHQHEKDQPERRGNDGQSDLADLYPFTSITNLNDASGYKSLYSLLTEPVEYSIKSGSFADSSFRNSYPGFQVSTSSKTLVWAYQIEVISDSPAAIDYDSEGDPGINTVEISTGIF